MKLHPYMKCGLLRPQLSKELEKSGLGYSYYSSNDPLDKARLKVLGVYLSSSKYPKSLMNQSLRVLF